MSSSRSVVITSEISGSEAQAQQRTHSHFTYQFHHIVGRSYRGPAIHHEYRHRSARTILLLRAGNKQYIAGWGTGRHGQLKPVQRLSGRTLPFSPFPRRNKPSHRHPVRPRTHRARRQSAHALPACVRTRFRTRLRRKGPAARSSRRREHLNWREFVERKLPANAHKTALSRRERARTAWQRRRRLGDRVEGP